MKKRYGNAQFWGGLCNFATTKGKHYIEEYGFTTRKDFEIYPAGRSACQRPLPLFPCHRGQARYRSGHGRTPRHHARQQCLYLPHRRRPHHRSRCGGHAQIWQRMCRKSLPQRYARHTCPARTRIGRIRW